jgi:two-component system, chemotaxis family, CheB/CheR fusion protein
MPPYRLNSQRSRSGCLRSESAALSSENVLIPNNDQLTPRPRVMPEKESHELENLLSYLKQSRGFDFTGYKRATLSRRIRSRMQDVGIDEFAAYVDYLEVHPGEFEQLFNTILINVTAFFRDAEAWAVLAERVLPEIFKSERHIRMWSAGCASGQEAYTLVMLMAEQIGVERFKEQVKVYGTDADEDALNQARQASYTEQQTTDLPAGLREKYFGQVADRFVFRNDLRRSVIFGRHDLVQDAPISRVDLLVCRNAMIYFNGETQARILARFHFALNDGGFLFMGKSEMLLTHARLFVPVDGRSRIFAKSANPNLRERLLGLSQAGSNDVSNSPGEQAHLREESFEAGPVAQIVVDRAGVVVLVNAQARQLFRLNARDLGAPIQDLELSFRPVEIRSLIEQAYTRKGASTVHDVEFGTPGAEPRFFDVSVSPLLEPGGTELGCSISYIDVTLHKRLKQEVERSAHEVETAYEELQATNEELETTNEELQSTVEELETTNEELQSTNEELETMNEELQSTNEELETLNEELRGRTEQLNNVNNYIESIMVSLKLGVVVLDQAMRVRLWNNNASELWGLRADEVDGKSFLDLDIGLPSEEIEPLLQRCLSGAGDRGEIMVRAINRRGRQIDCRVACSRLGPAEDRATGVVLVMEEWDGTKAGSLGK